MNPTLVLIADDHALVRAGIRALLEGIPNTEVIAEASDGGEAGVGSETRAGHCFDGYCDAWLKRTGSRPADRQDVASGPGNHFIDARQRGICMATAIMQFPLRKRRKTLEPPQAFLY
jgi:hypothetical protein